MTIHHRLAHRVARSSQATIAAVDKSQRLTHRNSDSPLLGGTCECAAHNWKEAMNQFAILYADRFTRPAA